MNDSIFLHYFIEDTIKIFTLFITKNIAPFYDEKNLNISFLIPKKSKSFSRKSFNL